MLDEWLDWASRSRLAPFVKLARTIRKHAVGILAYLDTRMTNGPVEGINNKLRVIARRAYQPVEEVCSLSPAVQAAWR